MGRKSDDDGVLLKCVSCGAKLGNVHRKSCKKPKRYLQGIGVTLEDCAEERKVTGWLTVAIVLPLYDSDFGPLSEGGSVPTPLRKMMEMTHEREADGAKINPVVLTPHEMAEVYREKQLADAEHWNQILKGLSD